MHRLRGWNSWLLAIAKQLRRLVIALAHQLDLVAHCNQRKKLFQVGPRHADASMRGCLANGIRLIGSVDSVARNAQPHPPRAHRIVWPRKHGFSTVVIGRIRDPPLDRERPGRARCRRLANSHAVDLLYFAVFHQSQLAVFETDNNHTLMRRGNLNLSLRHSLAHDLRCCALTNCLNRQEHPCRRRHCQLAYLESFHRIPPGESACAQTECKLVTNWLPLKTNRLFLESSEETCGGAHSVLVQTRRNGSCRIWNRLDRRAVADLEMEQSRLSD